MSGGVQKRWLSVKSRIIRSYFEKKPRSRKKSKKVNKRIKLLQYDKKIHLPGEDHTPSDVCCVSKRWNDIVPQPEAGENEQPDPTRQLREPTGIPNDDQTEPKSLIREDRVAKLALTRRE